LPRAPKLPRLPPDAGRVADAFLGDNRLGSVGAQRWDWKIEQNRILDRLESRLYGISETDIDNYGDACAGDRGRAAQADATILQLFADQADLQSVEIKVDAVVDGDRQNFAENPENTHETAASLLNSYQNRDLSRPRVSALRQMTRREMVAAP
jgi:hypothetical protein